MVTGDWIVESIDGEPWRPLRIHFGADGKVGGDDGCNSFYGEYGGTPDYLKMANISTTVVACMPNPPSPVLGPEVKTTDPRRLAFPNLTGRSTILRRADPPAK